MINSASHDWWRGLSIREQDAAAAAHPFYSMFFMWYVLAHLTAISELYDFHHKQKET